MKIFSDTCKCWKVWLLNLPKWNASLYHLRNKAWNLKQGDFHVIEYFNAFSRLWQELDLLSNEEWSYLDDATKYQKLIDKERIYDFLAWLYKELYEVWGRLLGINPLPTIEEIVAEVRREESRERVMLGGKSPDIVENSTLAVGRSKNWNRGEPQNNRRGNLWCDHYKR